MKHFDTLIIGGGIVGAACAYECAIAGQRTLLLDRADRGRATDAGAGIISPISTRPEWPAALYALARAAAEHYPPLVAALEKRGHGDIGYAPCGMLLVASDEDELMPFQNAARAFQERLAEGDFRSEDYARISTTAARALFPPIRSPLGVLHDRLAARVDGRKMTQALRLAAESLGVIWRMVDVRRLLLASDGTVAGAETNGENFLAGRTIIAGGAWSADFGEQLQLHLPIVPQRGQIAHLQLAEESVPETADWPIVGGFRGHYLVPWPDRRVVVGATRETGTGFDWRQTAAGTAEVLREALRLAPGLGEASFLEMRIGFRPLSADGLPILGAVPRQPRLFLATGHGPSGLHLGPYSAQLAARWAGGDSLADTLAPFGVERFTA